MMETSGVTVLLCTIHGRQKATRPGMVNYCNAMLPSFCAYCHNTVEHRDNYLLKGPAWTHTSGECTGFRICSSDPRHMSGCMATPLKKIRCGKPLIPQDRLE